MIIFVFIMLLLDTFYFLKKGNNYKMNHKTIKKLMCSQSAKRNQRDRVIRALFAHKMLQKQLHLVHLMCFMFGLALLSAELFWAWQL